MNNQPVPPTQKRPGGCAKSIAVLLAIVFILILPITLLGMNLGQMIFNPTLVKGIIADEALNSELLPAALEWFSDRRASQRLATGEARTGVDEPDIVLLMSFMDRADWREVRREVLTGEIITGFVSATVDGVYAWVDSEERLPQITWKLGLFKDRVNSVHGEKSILIAYDNLVPCTQAQIDDFKARLAAAPPGKEVLYNLCKFPDPWRADQYGDYVTSLHKVVANVPDQFELTQELTHGADPGLGAVIAKQLLRLLRLMRQWGWVAPAIILLLIVVAARSLRGAGVPVLLGGALALVLAIAYPALLLNLWTVRPFSAIPDLIRPEASRALARLAGVVFQPMLIQSAVITVIGLVLAMLGWRWGKSKARA